MTCSAGLCTRGATCVTALAAGAQHSCAVAGGQVQCWGDDAYGQLGIGSVEGRGADQTPFAAVALGDGRTPVAVATGGRHSCALISDGGATPTAAVCWGDNTFGQLGLPDRRARGAQPGDTLDAVPIAAGRTVAAISAGLYHTCALLDDDSVVCWGDDRFGQRGVGAAVGAGLTLVDLGAPARAVSAGAYHSCALLAGGSIRCWGWNDYGQLGVPDQPLGTVTARAGITLDLPVATGIAAGGFHTCAILQTGAVTCWGQNSAGQLGIRRDPSFGIGAPGTPVDLGRGRSASALGAGASHTCALLDDFSVKCWGLNAHGELGLGDPANNRGDDEALGDALPAVSLGPAPVGTLAVGANHACVIQAAGVKCWGSSDGGRLGLGTPSDPRADPAGPFGLVRLTSAR
jgi:alpha-tubulin suppressor-like RCC1 family protein